MCWSFSRDGAVPGHSLWSKVNRYTGAPLLMLSVMHASALSQSPLAAGSMDPTQITHVLAGTPINAVCFMVTLAFILGLPMLNSTVAFNAVISISVIGLYISCESNQGWVPGRGQCRLVHVALCPLWFSCWRAKRTGVGCLGVVSELTACACGLQMASPSLCACSTTSALSRGRSTWARRASSSAG